MTDPGPDQTLKIGVAQGLSEGRALGASYVGQIIDLTPERKSRFHKRDLIIPVGADASHYLSVDLPPGTYLVEAASPGGELFDTQIVLGATEEAEKVVSLGQSRKVDSELGWQVVSGNLDHRVIAAEQAPVSGPMSVPILHMDEVERSRSPSRLLLVIAIGVAIVAALVMSSWFLGAPLATSEEVGEAASKPNATVAMDVDAGAEYGLDSPYTDADSMADAAADVVESAVEDDGAVRAAEREAGSDDLGESASTDPNDQGRGPASVDGAEGDGVGQAPDFAAKAGAPEPLPPPPPRSASANGQSLLIIAGIVLALLALLAGIWRFNRPHAALEEAAEPLPTPPDARRAAPEMAGASAVEKASPSTTRTPAALLRFALGTDVWKEVVASFGKDFNELTTQWATEPVSSKDVQGFEVVRLRGDPGLDDYARSALLVSPACSVRSIPELIILPLPWHRERVGNAEIEVAISSNPSSQFRSGTAVRDEEMTTLMGYLSLGKLQEAGIMVRARAEALLDQKRSNPFAAALGGYVLLGTTETNRGEPWRQWISNLCAWFPWLPDGAVLQAASLLQQGRDEDFEQAGLLLVEATKRGIPVFSEGIRLLQSSFMLWSNEEGPMAPDMAEAAELVDKIALRCDPKQAITTIRLI